MEDEEPQIQSMDPTINDIPEGMARVEAMEHALKTASIGEDPRVVLARAAMYYTFLTTGRAELLAQNHGIVGKFN